MKTPRNLHLLGYISKNIGDDMQTYALDRALKGPYARIIRERSKQENPKTPTPLLVTGFMTAPPWHCMPFKSNIIPRFLAIFAGDALVQDKTQVRYLRENGPVGCRDRGTFERLKDLGVDVFFTGCPSILCPSLPREKPRQGIWCADVAPETVGLSPSECRWTTQIVPQTLSQEHRDLICHERHLAMHTAELIITNRIHIAIPAIGMGTPVLFVDDGNIKILGRLTALPDCVPVLKPEEITSLDPSKYIYSEEAIVRYKENVISCLGNLLHEGWDL